MNLTISVQETLALLEAGAPLRLVDVREADEFAICKIQGAELMPLSSFAETHAQRLPDPEQRILLYCHHGMRSLRAAQFLAARGYQKVSSMNGGIEAWALQIDPSIARY